MVKDDGYWWPIMVDGGSWWLRMMVNDRWWCLRMMGIAMMIKDGSKWLWILYEHKAYCNDDWCVMVWYEVKHVWKSVFIHDCHVQGAAIDMFSLAFDPTSFLSSMNNTGRELHLYRAELAITFNCHRSRKLGMTICLSLWYSNSFWVYKSLMSWSQ